jgi:hypothetical protein
MAALRSLSARAWCVIAVAAACFLSGGVSAQPERRETATPMAFRYVSSGGNCQGCEWFAAEGVITPETPDAFRRFFAEHPYALNIFFDSPGGNLFAGIELGREIRRRGISTSVGRSIRRRDAASNETFEVQPGLCASACALAFLGGVERFGGPVGFHQASLAVSPAEAERLLVPLGGGLSAGQLFAGLMVAYVMEMGADPRLIAAAMAAPSDRLFLPTDDEARQLGVVTVRREDPEWRLAVVRGGLVLVGQGEHIGRVPFAASLSCAPGRPGALRAIVSIRITPADWGMSAPAQDLERALPDLDAGGAAGVSRLPYRFDQGEMSAGALIEAAGQQAIRTNGLRLWWSGARAWSNLVPPLTLRGREVISALPLLLRNCPR